MISKKLVAASSEPLVLSILAQGESYGYALIQRVRQISKETLNWTDGMLYPVLHRLERNGLIAAHWGTGESGRRRRYYRITDGGLKALAAERFEWETLNRTLNELWGASNA
jgi:DNA-binding PadR family transcriptional regulator